jgi:hypothetical protein
MRLCVTVVVLIALESWVGVAAQNSSLIRDVQARLKPLGYEPPRLLARLGQGRASHYKDFNGTRDFPHPAPQTKTRCAHSGWIRRWSSVTTAVGTQQNRQPNRAVRSLH